MTTQKQWKLEIRKRINGCPRDLKQTLKVEREALNAIQSTRDSNDIDIEAAQAACKAFDAALKRHNGNLQHIQDIHQ